MSAKPRPPRSPGRVALPSACHRRSSCWSPVWPLEPDLLLCRSPTPISMIPQSIPWSASTISWRSFNDHSWWLAVKNTLVFTGDLGRHRDGARPGDRAAPQRSDSGSRSGARRHPGAVGNPVVVATKIWEWMLNDQFGVINKILVRARLWSIMAIAWTASSSLIMGVVIFIDVWMTTPVHGAA